jgi:beta-galactosidase
MHALSVMAPRQLQRGLATAMILLGLSGVAPAPLAAQTAPARIEIRTDAAGTRLQVNGADVLLKGVNWDYFPIGQNYAYSLWTQPDDVIKAALDREMSLLKVMGVNVIRQYNGVPPRWVKYIYEQYGIWTVLNHALGRYGTTINGVYTPQTDYSNPRVRQALTNEVLALVDEFRGTPGMLMWLLGNENNYGLQWKSAATENLPSGERDAAKATYLYSLVGEVSRAIKARDGSRPVALANGDLQYLEIIAREAKGLDVFGTNVYRGASFGDLFERVKATLGLPVMFTEFGADAYNARDMREDQLSQTKYLLAQWQEIFENVAGKGRTGNSIGGFTFQWTDGWWKYGQDVRLGEHDVNASWSNAAYADDYVKGENNMNEEWWGIVAKGAPDSRGLYPLYPRAAFYALQRAYQIDPYAATSTAAVIRSHFAAIAPAEAELRARAESGASSGAGNSKFSVSGLRFDLQTFNTGGDKISTPSSRTPSATARPSFTGFDRLESFYADLTARPADNFSATLSLNVLGNVPNNPIDEIYYENRARARTVLTDGSPLRITDNERLAVYRASVSWDEKNFRLDAFYRSGHYHWGYEGDFFGIYREANYGKNMDIYNGNAPAGMEFTGKRKLQGLKLALGPELWWGANPMIIGKYGRKIGGVQVTGLYQEEVAQLNASATNSSFAVPLPQTRRATLHLADTIAGFGVEAGGIWAGATRVGVPFQIVDGSRVLQDKVRDSDAFGGKAKVTYTRGRYNWYAQGAVMGLVADGGPTSVQTFTGWSLKETGLNNQSNIMTGLTINYGSFQFAPNVLYQKPIAGPVPFTAPAPARPRNILEDPFAVRGNRETYGAEMLLTFDPTPATWMYAWDNDMREDARFAANLGYVYRRLPTTMDAAIGILADGRTTFAFPGATPARSLYEIRSRIISKVGTDLRLIANVYTGTAEPNGNDPRLLHRSGIDLRAVKQHVKVIGAAKFNDWGPFDYHRDFNLTFPKQFMGDVSYAFGTPQWWDVPETKVGMRGTWRSLNKFSPRFCPEFAPDLATGSPVCDPTAPSRNGSEWEIRTYLSVAW